MKAIFITTAACAALALGGCQKIGTDAANESAATDSSGGSAKTGASAADVAAMHREPGQWRTTVEILEVDLPGVPEAAKRQMTQMMTQGASHEMCLTPEAAKAEDIAESMARMDESEDCTFDRKVFAAGKIDVAGNCSANGRNMKVALKGTATPTDADMTMTQSGDGPTGPMTMKVRVQSERVGDCPG